MNTEQTSLPNESGSPSSYASFWGKLRRKWDWWIYRRAYHSIKRMVHYNPGFAYLLELHLREWNEEHPIPADLKSATEHFHRSLVDHRQNDQAQPRGN